MWILMHMKNPTHFRLLLSLSGFQVDHESQPFWCQPSPKKSFLIYIAWNYHSAWIFAQKKIKFLSSQPWPKYVSCFANLRAWDSWSQDGWCLPHVLLPRFYSYDTGSITYHFHKQIPCTRCRRAHSNSQGWKGHVFPNTATSALFQCFRGDALEWTRENGILTDFLSALGESTKSQLAIQQNWASRGEN